MNHCERKYLALLWVVLLALSAGAITPPGTVIRNTAYAWWNYSTAAETTTISDTTMVLVERIVAAELSVDIAEDSIRPYDTLHITIRVRSSGNDTLLNSHLTDSLYPLLPSYLPLDTGWTALQPDSTEYLTFTIIADSNIMAGDIIYEWAILDADEIDTMRAYDSVIVYAVDSITISKVAEGDDSLLQTEEVLYTITVSNLGNNALRKIELYDIFPAGFEHHFHSGEHYFSLIDTASGVYKWQADTLPYGAEERILIKGQFDTTACFDYLTNRSFLVVGGDTIRSADSTFIICPPDIDFAISVSDTVIVRDGTLTYIITVTNQEKDTVSDLRVVNTYSQYTGTPTGTGVYDPLNDRMIWDIAPLAPSATETLTTSCTVDSLAPGYYNLVDCANLYWSFHGDTVNINQVCASTYVIVPFINVEKHSLKKEGFVGDIFPYIVTVSNNSSSHGDVQSFMLVDSLPFGFGYAENSSYWNGVKVNDPERNGRNLIWSLGEFTSGAKGVLIYQTVAGLGATDGDGINTVHAEGNIGKGREILSNYGAEWVKITGGIFGREQSIIGKVFWDNDMNGYQSGGEQGIADIALFTEDGIKIVTDRHGKFSIPDVATGNHIIRLDQTTLPEGAIPNITSSRNARDPYSILVYVPQYGIARANFAVLRGKAYAEKRPFIQPHIKLQLDATPSSAPFVPNYDYMGEDTLVSIFFPTGSFELSQEEQEKLRDFIEKSRGFVGIKYQIRGFADATPVRPNPRFRSNRELSEKRAKSVYTFLTDAVDIGRGNVEIIGYGERYAQSAIGGFKNDRRVDVVATFENGGKPAIASDSAYVITTTSIDYDANQPISEIQLDYRFLGIDYIAGSARFNGTPLKDDGNPGRGHIGWHLANLPKSLSGKLTASGKLFVKGYYRVAPRVSLSGYFLMQSGKKVEFELSRAVYPRLQSPDIRIDTGDEYYPPYIFISSLGSDYANGVDTSTVEKGTQIIYHINAALPANTKAKSVEIVDPLDDGESYIHGSAHFKGRAIEPTVRGQTLLWRVPVEQGEQTIEIEYSCDVTRTGRVSDKTLSVRVE